MVIGFAFTQTSVSAQTQETLTNETIVQMWNAKLPAEAILVKIKTSPSNFNISAAALQELKKVNVADSIILAMVQKTTGVEMSAPAIEPTVSADVAVSAGIAVPDGTEIKVATVEEISGKKAVEGDSVTFKVMEDVKINGKTVIAKDTMAKGTVTAAKKSGMMGKGGTLSIRVESVETVDGQKMKLRSSKSGEGGDNLGSTVALTILFGPLGLLRKGKQAIIKSGTVITSYTDENKTVVPKI